MERKRPQHKNTSSLCWWRASKKLRYKKRSGHCSPPSPWLCSGDKHRKHSMFKYKHPGVAQGERIYLHCRKCSLDPWVGKIPWRREWQPIQVLLLPWTEEPGWLQPTGSQRVGYDWSDLTCTHTHTHTHTQVKRPLNIIGIVNKEQALVLWCFISIVYPTPKFVIQTLVEVTAVVP